MAALCRDAATADGEQPDASTLGRSRRLNRPFGTYCPSRGRDPNVETLGYYRKSLRDRDLGRFDRRGLGSGRWKYQIWRSALVPPGKAALVPPDMVRQNFFEDFCKIGVGSSVLIIVTVIFFLTLGH